MKSVIHSSQRFQTTHMAIAMCAFWCHGMELTCMHDRFVHSQDRAGPRRIR